MPAGFYRINYKYDFKLFSKPFKILYDFFYERWVFGKVGCYTSGFVMYSVGMMQIYLMAAISFER